MTLAILIFLGLIALLWVGLAISPIHRVAFRDVLNADALPRLPVNPPYVLLIAPARNEAKVLPLTVPTYCTQVYPLLEVVIVDDQSEDETPAVLESLKQRHANLRTFRTNERPEGWVGKNWAVHSAVNWAKTARDGGVEPQILLFTDSDCAFHPHAVATVVREMSDRNIEMLSVIPRMEFTPFCEKIGLPGLVTVLSIAFPLGSVNNAKSTMALAAGGFIAIRTSAYEKAGGHESVRSQIVEDVNFARRAKSLGVRLNTRLTRDLVSTHMYENWADMWEGLSKNAYAGMDYQPRKFWVGLVAGLTTGVLPPAYLLASLAWGWRTGTSAAWLAFALSAVIVSAMTVIHARTIRHMGLPIYHALFLPISIALYLAIAVSSAYQFHFRGGNVWKGRRIR